jgi:hypothetical protein
MAFCAVGAGQVFLDRIGSRLAVTREVFNELNRHRGRLPNLSVVIEWLERDDEARVYTLSPDNQMAVLDLVRMLGGAHAQEHIGEVATVLAAVELIEAGQDVLLLMDDQDGRRLGKARHLAMIDCPALLVDMVCNDDLEYPVADRIWREKFRDRKDVWPAFLERLNQECPDKAPAKNR